MRLTLFSDYSLRVLLYAAAHGDRLVTVTEIAKAYRISRNHLVKVAAMLVKIGVVEATRGRHGGLRLALPPDRINVGRLVRKTEPDFALVECFDKKTNACVITPFCSLKDVLFEAQARFLEVLDRHTLADLLARTTDMRQAWRKRVGEAKDVKARR